MTESVKTLTSESEFLELYTKVVAKARVLLEEANKTCGMNWPAGSKWEDLVGTSKSIFMFRAREVLLIDDVRFLNIVRNWPYSDEGQKVVNDQFGC